jgi:hypothetical protein
MRRHDLQDSAGASLGLDFTLEPGESRRPARFRIEAGQGRIAVCVDERDHAFARVQRGYQGLWLALADRDSVGLLPPIESAAVRALPVLGAPTYLARWTRFFADRLLAAHVLEPGRFALTAAFDPALSPKSPLPICERAPQAVSRVYDLARTATTPAVDWKSWWLNGSGQVFRLRRAPRPDAARVKAWRKHARAGSLPPVLVAYVSGLDLFALLDGHDRLEAALAEHLPPPVLVLWRVREEPTYIDIEVQAAVVRELAIRREDRRSRRGKLDVDAENRVLLRTFPEATYLYTKTRAYPLRDEALAWEKRVRARVAGPVDARFFSGEAGP